MTRLALFLSAIAWFAVPAAAPAVADDDHARARAALEAGKILPLESIIAAARAHAGGAVLDVELEESHGGRGDGGRGYRHGRSADGDDDRPASFIYEVKLLAADGRIIRLDYDAETGDLLRERRKH